MDQSNRNRVSSLSTDDTSSEDTLERESEEIGKGLTTAPDDHHDAQVNNGDSEEAVEEDGQD